jgi:hypothetical protein
MKRIDISTRKHPNVFALVDDEDFAYLTQWKWSAEKRKHGFYAIRSVAADGKRTTRRMHIEIMGANSAPEIDHWDGDGLNNQRANLRRCTESQNQGNRRIRNSAKKTSKYKGVCWSAKYGTWSAHIRQDEKQKKVGNFVTEKAAAGAYNRAAIALYGEFAHINTEICMSDADIDAQKRPFQRGEDSASAKLSESQVIEIRHSSGPQKAIAGKFGISQTLVSAIKTRKVWAHL